MSDFTPGLPTQKTLVFTDNNGHQFTTDLTVNPGAPGANGDLSGALPLTGGTVSGTLNVQNGAVTLTNAPLTLLGSTFYIDRLMQLSPSAGIMMGNDDNRVMLSTHIDNGVLTSMEIAAITKQSWHSWHFNTTGTLTAPDGHTYIEDSSSTGRPILVQRFTVTAGNGTYIVFPQSFSSDNVQIIVPSYFDTQNFIVGGTTRQFPPNRNGFTLSRLYTGLNGTGWASTTDTVDIIAIGEI